MNDINFENVRVLMDMPEPPNVSIIEDGLDEAFSQLICDICAVGQAERAVGIMSHGMQCRMVERRADHLERMFFAVIRYTDAVLRDTAQNVSSSRAHDIRDAISILMDAAHDLVGEVSI